MLLNMVNLIAYLSWLILYSRYNVQAISEDDLEGRIVDGEYVDIRNYPHAVFLEVTRPDVCTIICGSSIVNQNFLLTAAHCISEYTRNDEILAYAGHEDLKKTNIIRKTQSLIVHEKYDSNAVENDIALVYLPKKLPLGPNVKRIIIKRSFPQIYNGAIAGWGVINDITYEGTMLLKAVTQRVINQKECSRILSGPGTLCAGSPRPSDPRPAEGDSGSGLITSNYQLIGLLSYKEPSLPALPVYTNVSYYYNWIRYHIRKKCLKN